MEKGNKCVQHNLIELTRNAFITNRAGPIQFLTNGKPWVILGIWQAQSDLYIFSCVVPNQAGARQFSMNDGTSSLRHHDPWSVQLMCESNSHLQGTISNYHMDDWYNNLLKEKSSTCKLTDRCPTKHEQPSACTGKARYPEDNCTSFLISDICITLKHQPSAEDQQ